MQGVYIAICGGALVSTVGSTGVEQLGRVVWAAGELPAFIANRGQVDASVRFEWRHAAGTTQFGDRRIDHYLASACTSTRRDARWDRSGLPSDRACGGHLGVVFDGPIDGTRPMGEELQQATVLYLLGNDSHRWHGGVPTFQRLRYPRLFPGIDQVFDPTTRGLKGTFEVAAGADPGAIRWHYEGASVVTIRPGGALEVAFGGEPASKGRYVEEAPVAWQADRAGRRRAVRVAYDVAPDGTVGFRVGPHDVARPLVIDPDIVFMSQVGHVMTDLAAAMDVNDAGEVVIAGTTESLRFPTERMPAPGTPDDRKRTDVFVSLLNAQGALVRTIILGSQRDGTISRVMDVIFTADRHVYVVGNTNAADFPNTNDKGGGRKVLQAALSDTSSAAEDMFITKLALDDSDCLQTGVDCLTGAQVAPAEPPYHTFSTYFGGRDTDSPTAAALDANGDLVIVGHTRSATLFAAQRDDVPQAPKEPLVQPGQETTRGGVEMVIATISADGRQVLNGTLFGGNGDDMARDVAIASDGTVWVVGTSTSSDLRGSPLVAKPPWPVVAPLSPSRIGLAGTGTDGLLVGLGPGLEAESAQRLAWFGGGLEDVPTGLAVRGGGAAVIVGHTISDDWLPPAVGTARRGLPDAFAMAVDEADRSLRVVWANAWGGNAKIDTALALVADDVGNSYLTGESNADGSVVDTLTFPGQGTRGSAAYLRILDPSDGHALLSARLGPDGGGSSKGSAIALGPNGDVWLAGSASGTMPGSPAPTPLGARKGRDDAFVARIAHLPIPTATATSTATETTSPTPTPLASPTATRTPTLTATATATATPTQPPLFLPMVVRDRDCPPQDVYTDVVLVIDGSTTMESPVAPGGRRKLDVAIDAVRLFIEGFMDRTPRRAGDTVLPPRIDRAGLILFNHEAYVLRPLTSNRDLMLDALSYARQTDFHSRINAGIDAAVAELEGPRSSPDRLKAIILLTDGIVNPDPPTAVRASAATAKAKGIRLFTVGFGDEIDRPLLWDISSEERSGAPYYYESPSEDELRSVYRRLQRVVPCPPFLYWPYP